MRRTGITFTRVLGRLGMALGVGVALLAGAGEPIRFSGRTGPAMTQDFDRREPLLPTEARSDKRGLAQPELVFDPYLSPGASVTPTVGLTRRQLEAQDRRRNWIFQSPQAILKQATERPEDDRLTEDSRDAKERPKSAVERYLDRSEDGADSEKMAKNEPSKPARDRRDAANSSASRSPRPDSERANGLETRGQTSSAAEERSLGNGPELRPSSALSRTFAEARERERQRERDASLDAFKRSLNNPWAQTASASNPTLAPGSPAGPGPAALGLPGSDLRRPASLGSLGGATRPMTDLGPRGGLGAFDPKNPLNYGAPATVFQNQEPPRAAPRPVVLEAPRRKF